MSEQMREEFEAEWGYTNEEQGIYFVPELNMYGANNVSRVAERKSAAWIYFQRGWQSSAQRIERTHPLQQTLRENGDLIAAQATIAQQAQMIEHLRGGPTPLYTAVDMANSARDGFKDGVESFKIRGNVLMEIFHDGGPEPFVCAIHGCICLEQLEAAQTDFRENMPDELEQGEGIYTFSFYYDNGQYDGYGRCEISAGWGFDFVSYKAFEAEEVKP